MGSDPPKPAGDALSQPTRARLFARLASSGQPEATGVLAGELGLHPSGLRVHLERLRTAGLIVRERVSQPRRRPRDVWSVAADAGQGQPSDAYAHLETQSNLTLDVTGWLARSIPARPMRLREVERAGRAVGRELLPARVHGSPEEAMGQSLTTLGFAPQRERPGTDQVVVRLGNCPYRQAVRENQPVVCGLRRGLTRGALDRLAPAARLTNFVPNDRDRAECLIEVGGLP